MIEPKIIYDSEEPLFVEREVKLRLYYEDHLIKVGVDESILQAAMLGGLEPPFSCQLGACSTCKAKLISGEIYLKERESLTDSEIDDNFILTCQAHPLSEGVEIDYDI